MKKYSQKFGEEILSREKDPPPIPGCIFPQIERNGHIYTEAGTIAFQHIYSSRSSGTIVSQIQFVGNFLPQKHNVYSTCVHVHVHTQLCFFSVYIFINTQT